MTLQATKTNGSYDFELVGQLIGAILEQRTSDHPTSAEGAIWERTDLDEIRAVVNGGVVTVYPTAAGYSDEQAKDAVGGILLDGTTINFTYDDAANAGAGTITAEVINGTLTNATLANMTQGTIKGRQAAGGTGAPEDLTAAQVKTILALTEADITLSATDRLVGRDTAAGGAAEEITVGGGVEFTGSGGIQTSAFTGDVTKTAGGTALTIPNDTVTNAKAANMAQSTIKGRSEGSGTGDPEDLSIAQVKAILDYVASDVAFTPAQGIAATQVQAAIEEVVTDLTALINSTVQGQKFKDPVDAHLSSAAPNSPTYNAGAGTLTAGSNVAFGTVDGVAAAAGLDYLLTGQSSTFQNGIYTLTTLGSGAAPWVLTRRSDADSATELQDAAVMVEAGTVHVGTIWTQVNAIADLTSAAQSWIETNRNEVYTAGTGLGLSANQFSITDAELLALAGLTSAADSLPYFTGSGTASLATLTAFGRSLIDDADAAAARATIGLDYHEATIGDGVATDITVTHSKGRNVKSVTLVKVSDGRMELVPWRQTSTNAIELNFPVAPTSNEYRVEIVV